MPVAQPGAPKCPPFASLCECNKNHYYYAASACWISTCISFAILYFCVK